ncbi:hypothetical protein AUQ44_07415 [Vibrio cidicii]|uniref:Uncharacterized protein n=1 Tax=Vibrio cidicii TaxID=1763883 RepID=A0A151JHZ2_9VIBR|nr:hypothetical protein AUQ44_07415 [Vibrio cidicii]
MFFFFILLFFMFSFFKIVYHGLHSGLVPFTPDWRTNVGIVLSGKDYVFYQFGVLLLTVYVLSQRNFNFLFFVSLLLFVISLSLYGGRFLLFVALIFSFYFRYIARGNEIRLNVSILIRVLALFVSIVLVAMFRYAYSESISLSKDFIYATITRQLGGNVYDFYLSYNYIDTKIVLTLLIDKFSVSLAPLLNSYEYSDRFASYLAFSAGRSFEGGHRVSAVGESFYLYGNFGVFVFSLFMFCMLSLSDSALRSKNIFFRYASIIILFALFFAFFIDLSYIFTLFYVLVLVFIVYIMSRFLIYVGSV